MFKKRELKGSKNQSNRRRKREDEDDDPEDNVDDSNLHEALSVTKQRRTMIDQLQSRRGVDASELLKKKNTDVFENNDFDPLLESVKKANPSAADALSSKTQLPTGGSIVAEEQRIWDQKHAAAMEEYVQERLKQTNAASSATGDPSSTGNDDSAAKPNHIASKDQLYRELAAQAAKLSGKTLIAKSDSNKVHDDSQKDVLTAGAATAIAEVILPVSDRLQAVKATAEAAAMAASSSLPNARVPKSAVPNRFRSSNNHHHPMISQDGSHSMNRTVNSTEALSMEEDRPGFAAARQLQQQKSSRPSGGHEKSTDDRVYQQFVKRQREQQSR